MNDEQFARAVDRWIADVKDEALRLYADRVPFEHCLPIAISIANAKRRSWTRRQQRLMGILGARMSLA